MSRLQIGAVCLFLALLSIAATRYGGYPAINDYHDIEVYFQRGSWVTTGQEPYRDVFSEYPQVATWLFAVPHVAAEAWSRLNGTRQYDLQTYRYVFSVLMALFLAATLVMLHDLRPDRKWLVFLLLLPAGWYFTHNRFDIVPAFLVLSSLAALRRNRYHGAFILLAIATATKWYALVLVPVFLVYTFHTRRRILFSAAVSYPLVLAVIVLPTLLAIGWEGFLIPYRFHLTRTGNPESLFHLLLVTLTRLGLFQPEPLLRKVFFLLQFAIAPLCVFARIDTWEKALRWSALAVICFILFAKFYSPQWILWFVPLLVLLARTRGEIAGIVVFDLVTFLYFPYIYYLEDKHPLWFPGIIALKTALLGIWLWHLLRREEMTLPIWTQLTIKRGGR